jgi:hypothetical protein
MTSHFQSLHQSAKENSIWTSLTNTSSRKTRPDLIQKNNPHPISIQTNENIHSGNDPNLSTHDVSDSKCTVGTHCSPVSTTGNPSHDNRFPNCSMEPTNVNNPDTYSSTYNDNFTTFILHKSNITNTNWKSTKLSTKTSNQPHFYAFDHGDHLHIVFPTKHHSNTNRTVNRILKFFERTSAGTATIQLVRHIKNFIIYLIRYGLRKFTKFGTKINMLESYFDALDEPDSIDTIDLTPCVAYIEQKKGSRNIFSNYTSRSTTIDYITSLIETTNATSYEDFQRKIDSSIKIQLLKQLGSQSKSLTIQLVKIYNLQQKMKIRQTHYLDVQSCLLGCTAV